MRKQIIAIASIASILCGLGVMGLVISIQHDPLAWTQAGRRNAEQPKPAPAAPETPLASPRAAPSDAGATTVVELPEVRITSSRQSQLVDGQAQPTEFESSLEPCSEWREIGPTYVEEGIPFGSQRVRQLC